MAFISSFKIESRTILRHSGRRGHKHLLTDESPSRIRCLFSSAVERCRHPLGRTVGGSVCEMPIIAQSLIARSRKASVQKADPLVFTRDDAVITLGVGKNMVRAIRHWGLMGCCIGIWPVGLMDRRLGTRRSTTFRSRNSRKSLHHLLSPATNSVKCSRPSMTRSSEKCPTLGTGPTASWTTTPRRRRMTTS